MTKKRGPWITWSQEDKAKYREYLVGLIDQALASDDFEISTPVGVRELPEEPGDTTVRREFTGEHTLHLVWREAKA